MRVDSENLYVGNHNLILLQHTVCVNWIQLLFERKSFFFLNNSGSQRYHQLGCILYSDSCPKEKNLKMRKKTFFTRRFILNK